MIHGTVIKTLHIWPGIAPGSETWKQHERIERGKPGNFVYNVVRPTLTAYFPERSKATGTSIIIAPGGAFILLAIDHEGHQVAQWLQEKGIAAFMLKYRVVETPAEFSIRSPFAGHGLKGPGDAGYKITAAKNARFRPSRGIHRIKMNEISKYGIADGIQALKVVRRHAATWGIKPNMVGFLGFSAGAMIAAAA